MKKRKISTIVAALSLGATTFGFVAQASAQVLEELIVTAQKREQSLSDVNLSVTAFSGDDIDALGFSNSVDIAAQTPSLSIGTPVGEGNNPSLVLRGVGINDFNDNNESTVSLYVDEVYLGALAGQTFQLFDVERVEVLRGPQGTLYGRNSTGGLIHFISKKPGFENEGNVSLNVGDYSLVEIEAAQDITLGKNTAARIAVAKKDHDGYVKNRIGPDANEANSLAYRVQLETTINDNWVLNLNAHGGESDTVAPQYQHQATNDGVGGVTSDLFGYIDTDGDIYAGEYSRVGVLDIETNGQSFVVTGDIADGVSFTSITAFESVKKTHEEDTDVGPVPGIEPTFIVDHEQVSQEFRLDLERGENIYTLGAYYYDADIKGAQDLDLRGIGDILLETDYTQDVTSTAIFGRAELRLSELMGLTIGLRYTDEEKDFVYSQDVDATTLGAPAVERVLNITDSLENDAFSGNVGLDWDLSDATSIYTTVARGFKSGGFNVGFGDGSSYDSETLTSYEFGLKTSFGRTRLNGALFYYDYQDLQALTFNSATAASSISNASDVTVLGGELEIVSNVTDNLLISAGLSVLDTKIDSISTPVGVLQDRNLVLAPETTANILARYHQTLKSGSSIAYQLDGSYKSEHFFDVVNQPVSRQGGYSVWNARVSWTSSDENLELALWAKNVGEKEYLVYTFDFTDLGGYNQQFFGAPRWVGASMKYSW
ncbi:MAG: TonB-dependent receptor [Arenicella sp.]|nr:TonB-dependent receptor [Arenicella sp.]